MVGPTRSKLRESGPDAPQSSRSAQARRRRSAGAVEPPLEGGAPPPEKPKRSLLQPFVLGGRNLPGGARNYAQRRIRNLNAQNYFQLEEATKTLLLGRFQFLHSLLDQLREKVQTLQLHRFSHRTLFGVAAFVGILHWIHLITLFENDRHFSHLSSLEREMTFRTEMGLYYSYFKTIIEAPSFLEGLWMIMNDRLTEYPLVINTVKRFHLYPEVVIAYWYRTVVGIMNLFGLETKTCWNVTRIEPLKEIQSCEGLGDPACFYVGVIFMLNGLMMGLFFIYGTYLSGSQLGGLITVVCYFFNHGEATRVMWTPPLRESFSYPFLVLQMYVLTTILRTSTLHKKYLMALCFSNVAFMLPWQFAQFILFTQAIMQKKNKIQRLGSSELHFWLIQGCAWWSGTIILKFLTSKICGVSDHIRLSDLIAARILRYTDFDTLIYTCAPEFDFMEQATPLRYTKTLLLPLVIVVTYFIFKKIVRDILCVLCTNTYLRKQLLENGELIFHTLQLLAFTALAILIMRLKLFLTPHMCIMASLICSRQLFGWLFCRVHFENVVFGILTIMSIQGCANLHNQWSIMGEFTNLPQEELIHWIKHNTRPDAVFAGAMPTMASIKLSTLHPIVNHPHYEDADLRARTKIVYSAYSRKSAVEVRDKLLELHVNYYVLEEAWCVVRTKPGCSMLEIWDVEDPSNAANPPLCSVLLKNSRPYFTTVFQNSMYRVLKIN
ncbi:probable C-mannosyltransferase DPY19L2 isoform X4 [Peromyscus californicus insignis]|uniref:probable C-mannosyltransferase DPY19L2 isoform X4 n=1 Tax=Peromyscus californicus insignis TaxID=564181 RepID=UPI0022A6BF99|nr:probable C-mannosyltransferase DPY19L2 isoform X4 [Peromyscus californicus insignis]